MIDLGGIHFEFGANGRAPGSILTDAQGKDLARSSVRQFKILIVEDESLVAENLKEILQSKKFSVVGIASSGKDAIDQVRQTHPDLILMDIRIKGDIDGIQTAIILQNQYNQTIPIIFVTAHSQKQFPHLSQLQPTYLYLTKPYSQEELLALVRKALDLK